VDPSAERHDSLAAALDSAIDAYDAGRFLFSLDALEAVRPQVMAEGTPAQRRLVLVQLLQLHVGFGNDDAVCEIHDALVAEAGSEPLDAHLVSPSVVEAVSRCSAR
jgi:hypothetical protein